MQLVLEFQLIVGMTQLRAMAPKLIIRITQRVPPQAHQSVVREKDKNFYEKKTLEKKTLEHIQYERLLCLISYNEGFGTGVTMTIAMSNV